MQDPDAEIKLFIFFYAFFLLHIRAAIARPIPCPIQAGKKPTITAYKNTAALTGTIVAALILFNSVSHRKHEAMNT